MIPMRQLHIPVYSRQRVVEEIGSHEAANMLGLEFTKQAPSLINLLQDAIHNQTYKTIKALAAQIKNMAQAAGADQIKEFTKDIFEECHKKNPSKETMAITIAIVKASLRQFKEQLSWFTSIPD